MLTRAPNPKRATLILGLVKAFLRVRLFLDTFQRFLPRNQNLHHVYERSRIIRYQKGKLNVIKRQKISFLGLQVFLTGLQNSNEVQNSHQNRSKNKQVCENAVTRAHESLPLRVMGSCVNSPILFIAPGKKTSRVHPLSYGNCLLLTPPPSPPHFCCPPWGVWIFSVTTRL